MRLWMGGIRRRLVTALHSSRTRFRTAPGPTTTGARGLSVWSRREIGTGIQKQETDMSENNRQGDTKRPRSYLVIVGEKRVGPLGAPELRKMAAEGELRPEDRVSPDGKRWYRARQCAVKGKWPCLTRCVVVPVIAACTKRAVLKLP